MRSASVLRSTAVRLAALFAAAVIGAFLVAGASVYELMALQLHGRQDQDIRETFAVIAAAYGDRDLTDLLDAVRTNIMATRDSQHIFLVTSPDGRALAGNIGPVTVPAGWSVRRAAALGVPGEDGRYRVYSGAVDRYRLIVGASETDIRRLEATVLASFAWASVLVIAVAIGGGLLIARQVRRRFDAVRETMERVSHGELARRIPLIGRGDDIDRLSADINEALGRLETTVEGMRQVSADIAHDLKTPLNRLTLTIEEALAQDAHGEPVGGALQAAASEAARIDETFAALLRIVQIESGARRARFATVDLKALVGGLVEIYGDVAADAGHSLALHAAAVVDGRISGDRELLTQMVANLIENAVRHTPAGTHIRIAVAGQPGRVLLVVEDDGPGIPEEERDRVFRRLYRLEKSRTSAGSGLGLSLVKAVADLHEATIRLVDARPGLRVAVEFAALA